MNHCPCGSHIDYMDCCGLFHNGVQSASSPEKLMRSRYSAYAFAHIDYIIRTMKGKPLLDFDALEVETWSKSVQWVGLEIVRVKDISPKLGYVEFIAHFLEKGKSQTIHEISEFHLIDGHWFYVNGVHQIY